MRRGVHTAGPPQPTACWPLKYQCQSCAHSALRVEAQRSATAGWACGASMPAPTWCMLAGGP
eukprot:1134690-Pelagomonas_calceolata.AAC.1